MDIFEELIKERLENDDKALKEACIGLAESVAGGGTAFAAFHEEDADSAISVILRYFHKKDVKMPEKKMPLDDMLEYVLQPLGIMRRRVQLDQGWYRSAYGAFLGTLKDSGTVIAILPGSFGGYKYYDETSGTYVPVNQKNEMRIDREAYCFYKPFPMRKIGIADILRFAWELITPLDVISVLGLYAVVTAIGMLAPGFTHILYGKIIEWGQNGNTQLLFAFGFLMFMTEVSRTLIASIQGLVMGRINTRMSMCVSAATLSRVLSLPVDFFRGYTAGELSSIMGYVNSLCNTLVSTILSTSLSALFSFLYVTQIFRYAPALVVPAIGIVIISSAYSIFMTLCNMKISGKMMKISAKNSGLSYALISGISKIKLTGSEKRAFARWAKEYSRSAVLRYNPPFFIKYGAVISGVISTAGTILMYYLTVKNGISISEYAAFNVAYGYMAGSFSALTGIVSSVAGIKPTLEMCRPILEAVPETAESKKVLTELKGGLSLDHVSFRYDKEQPYVLKDLSLRIKPGQYVAIVGKTGCGKSTLVRLLLGFETPETGAVYADGNNIKNVDLKSLRRHIGTVMQNGKAFHGDIFSNIVMASPGATLKDAWEAARLAGLDEEIERMPMGMNTVISEGQGGISGGQKQRLLIARAVVSKPNVLIFDEATSALDNVTQRKVSDALDALKCTRIVIAHRLSTIKNCDRIVVLDGGKIIEDGTYEELIQKNGFFRELVARQQINEKI